MMITSQREMNDVRLMLELKDAIMIVHLLMYHIDVYDLSK